MYRVLIVATIAVFLGTIFGAASIDENVINLGNDDESRIINGTEVREGEHQFMCSLQKHSEKGYSKFCGSTIIQRSWLLTAAHCMYKFKKKENPENITILRAVCGDRNAFDFLMNTENSHAQVIPVRKIIIHPNYNGSVAVGFDIAMVKLAEDIRFNAYVQPINLAPVKHNPINKWGKNIGWGSTHPTETWQSSWELLEAPGFVIDNKTCLEKGWWITDHMLCVYVEWTTTCSGDSGGPHIQTLENGQPVQVGIVSYGAFGNCSAMPAVFTDVRYFTPWIRKVFREE